MNLASPPYPPALIVPTRLELELLLQYKGMPLWPTVVCGVGPGAAALHAARFLERHGRHTMVLAGIAGGLRGRCPPPGSVCAATSEVYADLGRCTPEGIEPIELGGVSTARVFHLQGHLRDLVPGRVLEGLGVSAGPMATVCCSSATRERVEALWERYGCIAENMEGAAIAQACEEYAVPLLELRGISNWIGDRDRDDWATGPCLDALSRVIEALDKVWQE